MTPFSMFLALQPELRGTWALSNTASGWISSAYYTGYMVAVPVLAGLSRKSMIGTITGRPVDQRLHASVALGTIAILKGARIIRAHDVGPTLDAVKIVTVLGRDA